MSFGTIQLNDGHEIPAIAFGTGSVWKGKDVTEYVEQAIECGYSHIDTAAIYQTETGVALAIRESGLDRSDLYLTTKYDGGGVQTAIRDSLQRLGLKHVDLYLIHAPLFAPNIQETWSGMEKVKASGLAKSIGVSNFLVDDLQKLMKTAKIVPAVNQIRVHPYNYSEMKETIDYCSKHGIIIEAYNSLAPITEFPGGPVDAPIAAAAGRLGGLANPSPTFLGEAEGTSSKSAHLEEYLAVAKLGPLTQEEVAAIDQAGAKGPPRRILPRIVRFLPVIPLTIAAHHFLHCILTHQSPF
ncbi:hypothetical protein ONZ45_g6238 [Pleurotus djamor]|nr:hypothetical protein ONZ45_g6238 [Pleurotus djamor]